MLLVLLLGVGKPVLSYHYFAIFFPSLVSYLVLLPNDLRLLLALKWQHPENIIQGVEYARAFTKHVKLLRLSANRSARSDYKFR
jgi:hypothetical protein